MKFRSICIFRRKRAIIINKTMWKSDIFLLFIKTKKKIKLRVELGNPNLLKITQLINGVSKILIYFLVCVKKS